jgi:sugar phosphate isomerase/epimerase
MRLRHADGTCVHLAYCANVHPAETLTGIEERLDAIAVPVRRRLGVSRLGVGLWLPRPVSQSLDGDPAALKALRDGLERRGLEVVTLNGFPYRGFGDAVVKTGVYLPDWSTRARLDYTVELARILAALLPEDVERGSVSTLPLGWAPWWDAAHDVQARGHLSRLSDGLEAVAERTGRRIRVGFEPEPGCVVETTGDAAQDLAAVIHAGVHPRHREALGVCLDTCHLAVAFEEPAAALRRLDQAGLPLVKMQASAALHVAEPHDPAAREALERYAEPRFLHQTRYHGGPRAVGSDDLPESLAALDAPGAAPGPWRVHFHMPLHAAVPPPLRSTTDVLSATFDAVFSGPTALVEHVEVETYTWPVLPGGGADGLAEGIAAELAWTRDQLTGLGLTEDP